MKYRKTYLFSGPERKERKATSRRIVKNTKVFNNRKEGVTDCKSEIFCIVKAGRFRTELVGGGK
jgi:hypothetical protein